MGGCAHILAALLVVIGPLGCAEDGVSPDAVAESPQDGTASQTTAGAPARSPVPATGPATTPPSAQSTAQSTTAIAPLFGPSTVLEPDVLFDRGDAIVTRFGDRSRDRHAREDQFQSYDHYLPFYWEYRTARFVFVDRVAKGGPTLEVSFVTEWKLGPAEFRAWYRGKGSVAEYSGNHAPRFTVDGPGRSRAR